MDINTIKYHSPKQILKQIGERIRQRRLELNYTQKDFAKRVGMGYDAFRKVEESGNTSFKNIVLIAFVLDDVDLINRLFTQKKYQHIEEIIQSKESKPRKRASKS